MQQFLGTPTKTLPVLTAVPTTDGQGVALSFWASTLFGPGSVHKRFLAVLTVPSGSATFTLYANTAVSPASAQWLIPIDSSGNQGLVAAGATLSTGVYGFVIEDIGAYAEVALLQTTKSGSPTCTCKLTPLVEKQEGR